MLAEPVLQTREYVVYPTKGAVKMIWLPDAVSMLAVEDSHLKILNVFENPQTRKSAAENLDYGDRPSFDAFLDELIAIGAIVENAQAEGSDCCSSAFVPNINAFRVVMTEACNFRCPACFATTALRDSKARLRSMKEERVESVFTDIIPYGKTEELLIHFFGGEPLLNFRGIKTAVRILEAAQARGEMLPVTFAITTNGALITPEMTEFFKAHAFQVGISVEGRAELHNSIRLTATGEQTFSVVRQKFHELKAAGVDVHVLFTPYPDQQAFMGETLQFLLTEFPADRITINTAFASDTLKWLVEDGYANALVECERIAAKNGVIIDSALTPILHCLGTGEKRYTPQASTGRNVMVCVDPEGNVYRSSQKWTENLRIGSVKEARKTSFETTWEPECIKCEARHICGGPNEEFQLQSGAKLDTAKCNFHRKALGVIAQNIDLFEEQEGA